MLYTLLLKFFFSSPAISTGECNSHHSTHITPPIAITVPLNGSDVLTGLMQKSLLAYVDLLSYVAAWLFLGMVLATLISFSLQSLTVIYFMDDIVNAKKVDSLKHSSPICMPVPTDYMVEHVVPLGALSAQPALPPTTPTPGLGQAAATAAGQPVVVMVNDSVCQSGVSAEVGRPDGGEVAICRLVPINDWAGVYHPVGAVAFNRFTVVRI